MDISIVILNYKQKGLVKQCVKGIIAAAPKLSYELIIVDNNSGDGVLEAVSTIFSTPVVEQFENRSLLTTATQAMPPLITIQAPGNDGFAVGNNLGIKRALGKYVLVLNPDIAIVPGVLEELFAFMEAHPETGIVGPKLINPDGSVQLSCRRFPRWWMPLYRRTLLGKLPWAAQGLDQYLMRDFDHKTTTTVDWLFGAALLIRRSVLDEIGLFDERFFMYFEDLDLCRRSWERGAQVVYMADVEVVHYHQRLSAERSGLLGLLKKAGRIHLNSGLRYFAKYLGVPLPKTTRLDKEA